MEFVYCFIIIIIIYGNKQNKKNIEYLIIFLADTLS